ncbi:uncharacterized protein RJT21DRAFT_87307 [Scheffersomyces amazonensis]|uniref:uncharacterized protein n=1 Tax=Scheffersomyces amazonensis TaxID=1078765 RepID=UPI00315CEB3B
MSNPPFQRQPPGSPLHQHSSLATGSNASSVSGGSTGSSSSSSNQNSSHLHATGPHHGHYQNQNTSRKPSIVELLSSPPPLPNNPIDQEEIHQLSLSRHTSISSRTSSSYHNSSGNNNSSTGNHHGSIVGLDWTDIPLSELTESNKLISINSSYSVQKAFETLVDHSLTSLPVSLNSKNYDDLSNCLTFDYSDLNTYLLLVMNKININDLSINEIGSESDSTLKRQEIATNTINKAKRGEEVPVEFIIKLHPKNPFIKFSESDTLFNVMETLGNGVHRIAITDPETPSKITGILSQRRLIKYMWENARRFPSLDFYLNSTLQDLKIGSNTPITIYEDQLLIDALHKMFVERVSSLAVIDKSRSLIGNISIVDVKNVTSSKNSHLLFKSVLNFISYNLSQKGIEEGQDQFPIFHVNNQSSLGRVIAKLVATQSHRLWIVESTNRHSSIIPSSSSPTTVEATLSPQSPTISVTPSSASSTSTTPTSHHYQHSSHVTNNSGSPNSSSNPSGGSSTGGDISYGLPGKLIGVVSLTDILGLFASSKGRKVDPQMARNQRRRSSTSTTRSSIDSAISLDPTRGAPADSRSTLLNASSVASTLSPGTSTNSDKQ